LVYLVFLVYLRCGPSFETK